ncbi:MBL fold metallo-hydrolase [Deminuibacter soli]|uniref:MBL fold metallo-hydrolase n=1 Tax=Deminuibacter soli TaxID=2291815 RepID=A0A3E1NHB0_9BACT|nr:MBL fold metallo-hydrolase [Deminuibacter soli]RFM27339.1 MBL fold metallo-hydrolase [Deminuibacter soli]
MAPVQPLFAPDAPAASVDSILRSNFRPTGEVDLGMNILLVKTAGKLIMIDSGYGSYGGQASGWLPQSLTDAGFALTDITDIVVTHAHPDHIGGLLTTSGQFTFPNATIHMSALEHRFWTADKPDLSKSKFSDKALLEKIIGIIHTTLAGIKPKLQLFDYNTTLLGCIKPELAPGHTPGHTLVHVSSGNETLVHVADLVHSDVLLFPHPEWGFFGDSNFEQAAATRSKVLAALANGKTKVFAGHLAWPGLGHVRAKDQAFEWVPEVYAYPV